MTLHNWRPLEKGFRSPLSFGAERQSMETKGVSYLQSIGLLMGIALLAILIWYLMPDGELDIQVQSFGEFTSSDGEEGFCAVVKVTNASWRTVWAKGISRKCPDHGTCQLIDSKWQLSTSHTGPSEGIPIGAGSSLIFSAPLSEDACATRIGVPITARWFWTGDKWYWSAETPIEKPVKATTPRKRDDEEASEVDSISNSCPDIETAPP